MHVLEAQDIYIYIYTYIHTNIHTHKRTCTHVQPHTPTHLLISLPHTYSLVKAPAHDTLAVARPRYTCNIPCMALKHPDSLPCSNFPHTYSPVVAPTDNESVIRRQRHAIHPASVPPQCAHHCGTFPLKMPYNDGLVPAAADKQTCIAAAPRNIQDTMAPQGLRRLRPPNNIPHTYSPAFTIIIILFFTFPCTCTCNKSAVWRPCYTQDTTIIDFQCVQLLACLGAPNPHCPVARATCYFRAVRRNLDTPHPMSVPRERAQLRRSLPVRETPHLDATVVAAADKQGAIPANAYATNVCAIDTTSMGFSKRERAHAFVPVPPLEGPGPIAAYNDCAVA